MPRESFHVRLTRVMQTGQLTVADLSHWFNRPHPTVSMWVKGKTAPAGRYTADLAYSRLLLLEQVVRARDWSVPEMSAHKRPEWIRQARDNAEHSRRLSPRGAA